MNHEARVKCSLLDERVVKGDEGEPIGVIGDEDIALGGRVGVSKWKQCGAIANRLARGRRQHEGGDQYLTPGLNELGQQLEQRSQVCQLDMRENGKGKDA